MNKEFILFCFFLELVSVFINFFKAAVVFLLKIFKSVFLLSLLFFSLHFLFKHVSRFVLWKKRFVLNLKVIRILSCNERVARDNAHTFAPDLNFSCSVLLETPTIFYAFILVIILSFPQNF